MNKLYDATCLFCLLGFAVVFSLFFILFDLTLLPGSLYKGKAVITSKQLDLVNGEFQRCTYNFEVCGDLKLKEE